MRTLYALDRIQIMTALVIFMIYSTLGNILEHGLYYFSKDKKKVINNPIMTGFPLYGIAAYLVIAVHNAIGHKLNIVFQFLLYATLTTMLEYVIGIAVGAGANSTDSCGYVKAWDYSKDPFNFQGKIKLGSFVLFGVLALAVTRIHPKLKATVSKLFVQSR